MQEPSVNVYVSFSTSLYLMEIKPINRSVTYNDHLSFCITNNTNNCIKFKIQHIKFSWLKYDSLRQYA